MKIRISTVVWFALALLCAAAAFTYTENPDVVTWSDAVFADGSSDELMLFRLTGF